MHKIQGKYNFKKSLALCEFKKWWPPTLKEEKENGFL